MLAWASVVALAGIYLLDVYFISSNNSTGGALASTFVLLAIPRYTTLPPACFFYIYSFDPFPLTDCTDYSPAWANVEDFFVSYN